VKRVLILDDRPINRQFLTTLLAYRGFHTREAADGLEGLEVAGQWAPDLAIVDIAMPRMDGIEFVRRLHAQEQFARTPIIFYTASYEANEARRMADECGVAYVLVKPSEPEVILATIDEALGRGAAPLQTGYAAEPAGGELARLQTAAMRTSALVDFQLEIAAQRSAGDILHILCRAARNVVSSGHSIVTVGELTFASCADADCGGHPGAPQIQVPLETAKRSYGSLTLKERKSGDGFTDDDKRIAQTIAAQAAFAYENLVLYEEVQREAELLRHNIALLHTTIEANTDGIAAVDLQSRFVTFNSPFVEMWRLPEEIVRSSDADAAGVHAGTQIKNPETYRAMAERAAAGQAAGELLEMIDGRLIECKATPRTLDGEVVGCLWTFRDVTAQRAAEAKLMRVAREREVLIESTAQGIFAVDIDQRCTMANRVAAVLFGRSIDELVGSLIDDLIHDHKGAPCGILGTLTTRRPVRLTTEVFCRRDGSSFPVECTASPLVDDGVLRGAVVIFTDVTEHRQLERRVEQANHIDSLGRMAATIAHEFNNVLMGIQPFAEVIRRKTEKDEALQKAAGHILNSVARGKTITQDILRISKAAEPQSRSIELIPWLEQLVAEIRVLTGVRVNVELDVPAWDKLFVRCDPSQMQQVLTNLALNARDAMNGDGTLRIVAERAGILVRMIVADSGCGIAPETLPYIFEPLFTTKHSGTGLGLAVAQQIVVRNGGTIAVESTVGLGTRFTIDLMAAQPPECVAPGAVKPSNGDLGIHRVLIVEDEPSVASGLEAILEAEGVEVRVVFRGEEAAAAMAKFDPDAVLLDMSLPDMSGAAVYAQIAAGWPDVPVIFSTGHADESRLPQWSSKHVGFLRKPYSGEVLLTKLREVV
jgi:two-component system cell cycle sensor histidine kinase/response regulator CckA